MARESRPVSIRAASSKFIAPESYTASLQRCCEIAELDRANHEMG
jgi:hypothetical protein